MQIEFIKLLKKICVAMCYALNRTKQTQRVQVNIRVPLASCLIYSQP